MSVFEIFSTILVGFFAEATRRLCNEQANLARRAAGDAAEEAKFKAGCAALLFIFCAAWVIAVIGSHLWAWTFPC
jgi:hypothetical protein